MAEQETYQSLYRRFRPQRWSEVRGQDHITAALRNAVRDDRVCHAYLFSGPRGTGKTTSARLLAKALNCLEPADGEPCDKCESCERITAGASLDVQELDAASNNGVDAMRDLVSHAALTTPGRWKVYIIDEVHMLSAAASNALLKTLEEPPSHVIFVLATTDPQKVLRTIVSRTQHYEFRLLAGDVLAGLVRDIAAAADLGVAPDALEAAARRGQGSARDALSALDQVAAGGALGDEDDAAGEILDALAEPDAGAALIAVARALQSGRDPRRVAEELLDLLRQAFLVLMAPELAQVVGDQTRLAAQAKKIGPPGITRALEAIGDAVTSMKEAADARIALETALVRVTRADLDISPAALLERLDRLERQLAGGQGERAPRESTPPPPAPRTPADPAAPRPSLGVATAPRAANAPGTAAPTAPPAAAATSPAAATPPADTNAAPPTRDELTLAWGDAVLASLGNTARARYRGGRFVDAPMPTFALPSEIHRARCDELRVEVEQALSRHFGRPVRLALTVGSDAATVDKGPTPTELRPEDVIEEVGDVGDLEDAPPAVTSASARLLEAFPGAVEEST